MASLLQIRYSILEQVKGNLLSDDIRLRSAFIDKLIRDKRNLLVHQQSKRGTGIDSGFFQTFDCLKIECDRVTCAGYDSGVSVQYVKLPEGSADHIAYLGNVEGTIPFLQSPLTAAPLQLPGRFGRTTTRYMVAEGRAILVGVPSGINYLRLVAVINDPINGGCLPLQAKQPYPIPIGLVAQLETLVIKQLLSTQPIQPDNTNNASDTQNTVPVNPKTLDA